MAWIALFLAGLCEIGWPVGLKLGWTDEGLRPGWLLLAIVAIVVSGALLMWAQRTIPMGTAYAIWTGIGAVGVATLGIALFSESVSPARLGCIALIIAGVVGLKLFSPA